MQMGSEQDAAREGRPGRERWSGRACEAAGEGNGAAGEGKGGSEERVHDDFMSHIIDWRACCADCGYRFSSGSGVVL